MIDGTSKIYTSRYEPCSSVKLTRSGTRKDLGLTVDAAAVQCNSCQVADEDGKTYASRGKNGEVGSALSPGLVSGSEDDKDQNKGQQRLHEPAGTGGQA